MAFEIAGGIAAPIGQVLGRLLDLGAGGAGALAMGVDIGEIDEDALSRDAGLARAGHAPILRALAHHDRLAVDRHLAMHAAAWRSMAHDLREAEGAGEPVERRRDVAIEDVRDNLGPDL